MRHLGRLLRFIFGCEALASVVLTPTIIRELQDFGLSGSVFSIALLILTLFTLVTGVAWLSLHKGWSSARAWGIAASLINLLLFPIGIVVTIAGLMAFWRRKVMAEIAVSPKKRLTPIPGDGTNKYSGSVLAVLQVALSY